MGPEFEMGTGAMVLIGVLVALVGGLAWGMIVVSHNKFNDAQMELVRDSQSFHDVGASKIAGLLGQLACLNVKNATRELKMILNSVRSPKDALNLFQDMWFKQLTMRLDDASERQKIIDVVTAAMQADQKATLTVVNQTQAPAALVQETTTKLA